MLKTLVLALCAAAAAATNSAGEAFLAENAQKEGVVTLASGLQYKVLESGPSPGKSPLANSPTECHYAGTLIDGTEFDSSYKRGGARHLFHSRALLYFGVNVVFCFDSC